MLFCMADLSELRVCKDCGTVYAAKYSKAVCPNSICKTNNNERLTDNT